MRRSKNPKRDVQQGYFSKKVHSSYLLKAQKGQFTGCVAPFGYQERPGGQNHLLVDPETAPIVRLIFGVRAGGARPELYPAQAGGTEIPCPTWWNREQGFATSAPGEKARPGERAVYGTSPLSKDLLMNPVYTGAIASQKTDYRFKIRNHRGKKTGGLDCGGGAA